MRRKATFSFLIPFCISAAWFPKPAQSVVPGPGDLDPTYGINGKVRIDFTPTANMGGAALQPDGKIVVAGAGDNYIVARYTMEGSPDQTFGSSGGRQTSPFIVLARAVAI